MKTGKAYNLAAENGLEKTLRFFPAT